MAENGTSNDEEAFRELCQAIALQLYSGATQQTAVETLVSHGAPEEEAKNLVEQIANEVELARPSIEARQKEMFERQQREYMERPAVRAEMAQKYSRRMLWGLALVGRSIRHLP